MRQPIAWLPLLVACGAAPTVAPKIDGSDELPETIGVTVAFSSGVEAELEPCG